ncbi:hypothetical protein F5Y04DRAFT_277746 [Hypomontagnella monticulosa]|nr:hypothetical protein F5Y04DRAFT_277746 [Hypomontagnella monticulosa]
MKSMKNILVRVLLADLLWLVAGTNNTTIPEPPTGPPGCASRCMSLFQCLYSQCDTYHYGPALSHSISLCISLGAEIYMVAPGVVDNELLRSREADYLAGRAVQDVPGLHLRQESAAPPWHTTTVTTTVTAFITVSMSPITFSPTPTPSAFLETSQAAEVTATSTSRPWVIPVSPAARSEPSFFGLVLWIAWVVLLDYWVNGY